MGIKDLWTILTPFCDKKPLYELQNKKIAVDLSCWICEAQNIAEYQVQPRMYLRNLYFRTCYLLLMDVIPVFVLEGKAPELKYQTIAARNAIQFKGAKPKQDGVKTGKDRSRFHHVLKQCEEMLKLMGLACVKGAGEAEALCAYLNKDNLVDGIISQDSDCFAYGARIVYRNFSISTQGTNAAKGGSVDIYDITRVNQNLNFGRNKIIALALLCGSDYSDGIHGIGKDSALKLFEKIDDNEILDRLRNWRTNNSLYEEFELKISNKNICSSCGHSGRLQNHNKNGCSVCKTSSGCDFTKFKDERLFIKNEINMRKKALVDPDFPNETLIEEFLSRKDNVSELNLNWNQPDLRKFIEFTVKFLTWEAIYAFEKFLPIVTRWQLLHYQDLKKHPYKGVLIPIRIKKVRNPKGIPSFEIIWSDQSDYYKNLIPDDQLNDIGDLEKLWSTIEPQYLVEKAYPKLVEDFWEIKKPKAKRKKKTTVDNIDNMMKNISISEPVVKKTKNKLFESEKIMKIKRIDSFFNKDIKKQQSSTPIRNNCVDNNLEMSNFGDENDLEVSEIIDDIISRKLPNCIIDNLKDYGKEIVDIPFENQSSFFISQPIEDDLFERTFNELCGQIQESPDKIEEIEEDSFIIDDTPLFERIKKKQQNL